MFFAVLCPGTPECLTGNGSGFKVVSQKMGQRLKVSSVRLGEARNLNENYCLWLCSLARVGLWFLWLYVQEHPRAQPAVVLVLKYLRRWGNGLKSHPTDWEKPGIEPATHSVFLAVFLGRTSTGWESLCFLLFYVQELLKAQPAVVLVLKGLRRRGNGLKSHQTDWEKPGIHYSSTTWNIFIKFCLLII